MKRLGNENSKWRGREMPIGGWASGGVRFWKSVTPVTELQRERKDFRCWSNHEIPVRLLSKSADLWGSGRKIFGLEGNEILIKISKAPFPPSLSYAANAAASAAFAFSYLHSRLPRPAAAAVCLSSLHLCEIKFIYLFYSLLLSGFLSIVLRQNDKATTRIIC